MLLVVLRIWQLSVYQYEEKFQETLKPQQKIFLQQANRGCIYDRFGIPLAENQIHYQAGVFYSPIRKIPSVSWKRDEQGKKIRSYPRREYVEKLSHVLSNILQIDAHRIEDLIHAKASIRFDAPFILKDGVSEKDYHMLRALEAQWPGLYAGMQSRRHYPRGKVGGAVVGYMGAINQAEYEAINQEKYNLEQFLEQWQMGHFPPLPLKMKSVAEVRQRLKEIKARCYSVYDWVGKSGAEAFFNESLRGFHGKSYYSSDAKSQFLKPLAFSQKSFSGKKLSLTLSAELQQHAEELLIENERIRRSIYINPTNGAFSYQKEPWIKGGAIVVMDPNNGEVLTLASCPRFDPNDFIFSGDDLEKKHKRSQIVKWLESEEFVSNVWDQQVDLTKEIFDRHQGKVVESEFTLTWDFFLNLVVPQNCPVKTALGHIHHLKGALELQDAFEKVFVMSQSSRAFDLLKVLYKEPEHRPYPSSKTPKRILQGIEDRLQEHPEELLECKKVLDSYLSDVPSNYDKLLVIDLCRLNVNSELVSLELRQHLSEISLSDHRRYEGAYCTLENTVREMSQKLFSECSFRFWRKQHQKSFLKEKRRLEQQEGVYAKPFIDYLDKEEKKQFDLFWQENKSLFLSAFLTGKMDLMADPKLAPYLNYFMLWAKEVQHGAHFSASWHRAYQEIKTLFEKLPPDAISPYLKTLRNFDQLTRPLWGKYRKVSGKKPTEKDLAKSFYPQYGFSYSRSYAYSQATPQGSLFKLVTAYEALRQKQSSQGKVQNPLTIIDDLHMSADRQKWNVGYFSSGEPISQYYKGGRLARSHRRGIGKIDLADALAVSSNCYFGILANDSLKHPEDLNRAAKLFSYGAKTGIDLPGEIAGKLPKDLGYNQTGLYSYSIGQHTFVATPLQATLMLSALANQGKVFKPQIVKSLEGVGLHRVGISAEEKRSYDFKDMLANIGIDFPLFTCKERGEAKLTQNFGSQVKRDLQISPQIQNYLFKSMHQIVNGKLGTASPNRVRNYSSGHPVYQAYQELKNQMIGKTSSAEIREAVDLDLKHGVNTYKHVWFGSIIFEEDIQEGQWPKPELVVMVYLRYGDFGREAAPLAASVAKKWREIKKKHEN